MFDGETNNISCLHYTHNGMDPLNLNLITHVVKGINARNQCSDVPRFWSWLMIHVFFFTLRCLKCSASFFTSKIFFLTIDLRSAWSNLYFSSAASLSNPCCSLSSSTSSSSSLELYCNFMSEVTLMSSKLYSFLFTKSPAVSSEEGKVWAVYTLHKKIFL